MNHRERRELETNRQKQVNSELEQALGNSVICGTCNATMETFADRCTASLCSACPGFMKIDEARRPIVARIYGFSEAAA